MSHRWVFFILIPICIQCSPEKQSPESPVTASLPSLQGKRILFVAGGWEGHHPQKCAEFYVPRLQALGASVLMSNSLEAYTDTSLMKTVDLVIQVWTLGEITPQQLNGLLDAVRNGTGFAGWHGGVIDAFRGEIDYHMMTGGQFLAHPGDILEYKVHVTAPDDPIMQSIHDFTINTEQYYLLTDPNIEVLAETTFDGGVLPWIDGRKMPVIWKHRYGKGKVFVHAIGHRMEDHDVPEFRTVMERGIMWACR